MGKILNLPHASPIVRIGQHDLNRIEVASAWNIPEGSDGNIAGKGRLDTVSKQPAAHFCHAIQGRTRIFEIASTRELVAQRFADADRSVYRPRAVRIDTQRDSPPKCIPKGFYGFDLNRWLEHSAFQLDLAETILVNHLPAFADG